MFPQAPRDCYAVIFSSQRTGLVSDYEATARRMVELASVQPGFLGVESVRDASGQGITISYWASRDSIDAWGRQLEHRLAQARGRNEWYEHFALRICRVEESRTWESGPTRAAARPGND